MEVRLGEEGKGGSKEGGRKRKRSRLRKFAIETNEFLDLMGEKEKRKRNNRREKGEKKKREGGEKGEKVPRTCTRA